MASAKSNECLVGCEVSGGRIQIAALVGSSGGYTTARRLRCADMVIPDTEGNAPGELPHATTLTPPLKSALSRLGVSGGRAVVALGPPYSVLRHFLGREDEVQAQCEQAAERSLRYLHFGIGERVAAETLHQFDETRMHGLLAVSPANAIIQLNESLKQAGLLVVRIEPRMVALARIATLTGQLQGEVSFLVCVDPMGIEIALLGNGHILLSHRPTCDGSEPGPANGTHGLTRELERVSRHYSRTFGEAEAIRSVILSGADELAQPCVMALKDAGDFHMEILTLGNDSASALDIALDEFRGRDSYAMALGSAASLATSSVNVTGPNLVAEHEERKRPPVDALLKKLVLPTLVAIGLWGIAAITKDSITAKAANLRTEAEYPSVFAQKYRELQMELTHLEQRAVRMTELVERYQERHWENVMETVRICVPDHLWLTRVRFMGEHQLKVLGATDSESLIYEFARNIEGSPQFASATIISQTSSREGNVILNEFVIECGMAPDPPNSDSNDS